MAEKAHAPVLKDEQRKPGVMRRIKDRVFKGKKDDPRLALPGERQIYSEFDILGRLRQTQEEGWEGEKMHSLLRLKGRKEIYGRTGSTSFFCDSESAPLISLEESRNPKEWPKSPAAWSVSLHESNTSGYCTYVDLNRTVDNMKTPIIVRAQIGGMFSKQDWSEFQLLVKDAEDAAKAASEKGKRFDAVLNDCGRMSLVKLR